MNQSPSISVIQNAALFLMITLLGVMSGFFWTYSFNVNLAMLEVSGEYYATMQTLFNENVRNPMFFSFFFGGGVVGVLAILLHVKYWKTTWFWLIVLATLIYLFGIIVFTREVNLPLNYYTESWDPKNLPQDWQSTRDQWNQANMLRVVSSFSAFAVALLALFLKRTR